MSLSKKTLSLCAAFLLSALYSCSAFETIRPDDAVEQNDIVEQKHVPEQSDAEAQPDAEAQQQQTERVMIRVANTSDQQIDNIVINFAASDNGIDFVFQSADYGSLAPAEMSLYHHIDSSFRYAPMEVSIDDEQIRQGVTDFVGEVPIPNGNYTYELTYGPTELSQGAAVLDSNLVYD